MQLWTLNFQTVYTVLLLAPANEVWDKVMFLHLCVILFTGWGGSASKGRGLPIGGCLPPGSRRVSASRGVCIQGVDRPHPHWILQETVNIGWYVCILVCILVYDLFLQGWEPRSRSSDRVGEGAKNIKSMRPPFFDLFLQGRGAIIPPHLLPDPLLIFQFQNHKIMPLINLDIFWINNGCLLEHLAD